MDSNSIVLIYSIAKSPVSISVLLLLLGVNSIGLADCLPDIDVPKVSVSASTSIVQAALSDRQQIGPKQELNPGTGTILSSEIMNNGRQQRSLVSNNKQQQIPSYYLMEPKRTQYYQNSQESATHKSSSNEVQDEPMLHLGYLRLNPNNRVLELQPPNGYRQSLSTSWSAVAPPSSVQQAQYSMANQQRATSLSSQPRVSLANGKSVDVHCQRRSLSRTLRSAKNLLTDKFASLEQYATTGNLMVLGSSLLAGAIPLAAMVLPANENFSLAQKRRAGSAANEPALYGSSSRLGLLQSRVDSVMGWIERSVEHLPNFPRLHPQECVKRSICEAHNEPNKHGVIAFILRLLFPATNLSSTDRMDNMEYKVINKYRHAAGFGLSKRLDNNGTSSSVCKEKYEDCLVSLLDVAQSLMDIFLN